MNAVDPVFNEQIFDAAFEAGCNYMDMAMTLSDLHPTNPYQECGVKLGDYQFERAQAWEQKGLLALVGMGVEPGMADVFARYAEKHLFDEIDEIGIRDGANLEVRGYEFAPNFSIWTTIEECLNPPVIWEKDRGWFTTAPFSEPEMFEFPEGIGPVECVNVEHEEVLLVPRWVNCKRVTFKYGLGDQFIGVLKTIKMLGLDNKDPIKVKGVQVAPARRRRRLSARPGPPGRPHVRQDVRRHVGQGNEGRQAAPGLPLPGCRQRDLHGKIRRAGRRLADRRQPGDRDGAAGERRLAGHGRAWAGGVRPRPVHGEDGGVRFPVWDQGDVIMFGFTGKILHVNLTTGGIEVEQPPEEFYRTYWGGSLMGTYYLLKNTPPGADPLGPENTLSFMLSPTTGVPISGQSRCTATAKSPTSGLIGDSQAGGFWPAELKFAGFDGIVLTGRSPKPVYLWVHDGEAELRDAAHLWGTGRVTGEVEAAIKEELGDPKIEVTQVGTAGERLSRLACIINMSNRAHGRTGMGAVMGSKNLKAIAVRGHGKVNVADQKAVARLARQAAGTLSDFPGHEGAAGLRHGQRVHVPGHGGRAADPQLAERHLCGG